MTPPITLERRTKLEQLNQFERLDKTDREQSRKRLAKGDGDADLGSH